MFVGCIFCAASAVASASATASWASAAPALSASAKMELMSAAFTASNTSGTARIFGRKLRLTDPDTRTVLPAPPLVAAWPLPCTVSGSATATISGRFNVARDGARLNPRFINSVTLTLRDAVDAPPKTVAMIRSCPRCADATRLNPAARV